MKAQCQCGDLTAEIADGARSFSGVCHCLDCQRRSGSPFGAITYFHENSITIAGSATEFVRPTDEGNHFTGGFCPRCGSTVYARTTKHPTMLGITIGTLADPLFPPPVMSLYEQSRHGWVALPDGIRRHPRGSDS